jgi:hypothetical protein
MKVEFRGENERWGNIEHRTPNIEHRVGDGEATRRAASGHPDLWFGARSGGRLPHSKGGHHPKVVVENPTYAFVTGGGLRL